MKIAVIDTMFSRVNMGEIAIEELKSYNSSVSFVRSTVPGVKDLPVECKILLEKENCDIAIALGMVGGAPIDTQCAHEASLGIQQAKLLTNKHIIEVFVHENEAWSEKEFFEICNNRIRKHVHNTIDLLLSPNKLIENAGKGIRQGKEDEGSVTPLKEKKPKLAFVVCEFNKEITSEMESTALSYTTNSNTEAGEVIHVPGAYDVPLAAKKLLYNKSNDAIVVLGAILKGDTLHDEVIGHSTAQSLAKLSLEFNKPIALGIIGPGATEEQAHARKKEYAERAVDAAIKLIQRLRS